jgi:hypothetical protein
MGAATKQGQLAMFAAAPLTTAQFNHRRGFFQSDEVFRAVFFSAMVAEQIFVEAGRALDDGRSRWSGGSSRSDLAGGDHGSVFADAEPVCQGVTVAAKHDICARSQSDPIKELKAGKFIVQRLRRNSLSSKNIRLIQF